MTGTRRREPFPYGHLLWEMTRDEVLMRDQGTVLGFVWTLLHPALMFVVLYGLFSHWIGDRVDQYMSYLLIGIVLWDFFQKSTTYALGSLRRLRGTVLNYRFPREIAVFASVAAVFWSSLMEVCVLLVAVALLGQTPRWSWLLLPGALALELLLCTGVGLFLAVFGAEFQDMERIWDVLTSAFFYLTPVFYPLSLLSPRKQALLGLNPLALILETFRACVIPSTRAPGARALLALLAGSLALAAAGLALLRAREPEIADKLLV
ncbi:MAG: ABC transporter permease [Elusimicrobia bacterium]|nr:ABC transporter permease [Elusimicrobiota bacterium]